MRATIERALYWTFLFALSFAIGYIVIGPALGGAL